MPEKTPTRFLDKPPEVSVSDGAVTIKLTPTAEIISDLGGRLESVLGPSFARQFIPASIRTVTTGGTTLQSNRGLNFTFLQDVEEYKEDSGISTDIVKRSEAAVVQFQWTLELERLIRGPYAEKNLVKARRWGTGTLIAPDLVLTAGHLFLPNVLGHTYNRKTISPFTIARMMRINFKYQMDPTTGSTRQAESFPIAEMVENGRLQNGPDYAIVRIGPNDQGGIPGPKYPFLCIKKTGLVKSGESIAVIQHPNGGPKKVETGKVLNDNGTRISYGDVGTESSSSGSSVLTQDGTIVGVHTEGGLSNAGGYNSGASMECIRRASTTIKRILRGDYPGIPA